MAKTIHTQIAMSNGRLRAIMTIDPKEVGQRLAAARNRRNWTQLEFALQIGKSPSSVARWERGGLPPVRELIRICEALGIDPAELVEEPEDAIQAQIDELQKELHELRQQQKRSREREHS